jgi:hypothetical protein
LKETLSEHHENTAKPSAGKIPDFRDQVGFDSSAYLKEVAATADSFDSDLTNLGVAQNKGGNPLQNCNTKSTPNALESVYFIHFYI